LSNHGADLLKGCVYCGVRGTLKILRQGSRKLRKFSGLLAETIKKIADTKVGSVQRTAKVAIRFLSEDFQWKSCSTQEYEKNGRRNSKVV
jgi:hypothetical protein